MAQPAIRRIALLSVHTSPLATLGGKKTGGMNVYIRDVGLELGRRGVQVDIFTRSADPDQPRIVTLSEHVRVIHVPAGAPTFLSSDAIVEHLPAFIADVLRFAEQDSKSRDYDIIFSHYWLSGWVAHELRAQWRVPVVQMFHTLGRMKNRIAQQPGQAEADNRIFTETDVISWADRLIAATPAERAQMLWLYRADRRKIAIVPPGVDLARFHPLPRADAKARVDVQPDSRLLLFVGRIEPLKGVDNILRAMALLRESQPTVLQNVCAVVIGGELDETQPDDELHRLLDLREELAVRDRVRFLGARDQELLPYFYNAAEALIMPSDYESFGMVALEAMACGTPVIASEIGGLAFLVQDGVNGLHVPTREPAALAERIEWLLSVPERRDMISDAARRTAQDYGWPSIVDRLLAIFTELRQDWTGIDASTIPASQS